MGTTTLGRFDTEAQRRGAEGLRIALCACLLCASASLCRAAGAAAAPTPDDGFLKGGDVSLLAKIEALGGVYRDNARAADALAIFKARGCNCMRLRIFHSPNGRGPVVNDLAYTRKLARRIKAAGLKLLLDFHYSDTWADPGHQTKPAAWQHLPFDQLKGRVFEYTRDVIAALNKDGALPDVVQIGNEIRPGMLWPDGRVGGKFDTDAQWSQLAGLVGAGLRGVKAAAGPKRVRTMIHIDSGGSRGATRWFFDNLLARKVDFDMIGLSYYPWWHGSMDALRGNLAATSQRYKKDIVVVETAFPWAAKRFGRGKFVDKQGRLAAAHPQTPAGQRAFLAELIRTVRRTPGGRGKGVLWWAPEWLAVEGMPHHRQKLALFDERGRALPAMSAFAEAPR